MHSPGIVLIGMPGSGKSTTAALLSNLLSLPLTDTDALLSEQRGISIAQWFERYGEADFRSAELSLLKELQARPVPRILATGGGMPCIAGAPEILSALGMVFFLDAGPDTLLNRTASQNHRPLLNAKTEKEELLRELHQQRRPFYLSIARFVIPVGEQLSPSEIAGSILSLYSIR